jgi:hypothetical protein
VALKSAQELSASAENVEELLDTLDKNLERVKTLYEQYFLGIQKQAPAYLHTDIERKLRDITQLQIRNTGLRYRFATLQQKFGAYNSYWKRTLRQIENGTYLRNLSKIGRDAIRSGAEIPGEILAAMPKRMREQVIRDREAAIAIAKRRKGTNNADAAEMLPPEVDDVAAMISEPTALRRELKTRTGAYIIDDSALDDTGVDLEAFFDEVESKAVVVPRSAMPAAPGPSSMTTPTPTATAASPTLATTPNPTATPTPAAAKTANDDAIPTPIVPQPSRPVAKPPAIAKPPPTPPKSPTGQYPATKPTTGSFPAVNSSSGEHPAVRFSTGQYPQVASPAKPGTGQYPAANTTGQFPAVKAPTGQYPAVGAPRPPPMPPAKAPSQTTRANPIAPGAAAARGDVAVEAMSGPFPAAEKPAPKPAPMPARPAVHRPPPGMTDADVNALYAKYVQAKQMVGEATGPREREKLLKTINAQAPKIMEQYKAKGVDFTVVVKDNQVIIRAKPKT